MDLRKLLQVGRVIQNADGKFGIILPNRIIYQKDWSELKYDNGLRHTEFGCSLLDIVAVYEAPVAFGVAWHFDTEGTRLLEKVWPIVHKPKFSHAAKTLLSLLPASYTYIARDTARGGEEQGDIYAYPDVPVLSENRQMYVLDVTENLLSEPKCLESFNELFGDFNFSDGVQEIETILEGWHK